MFFIRRMNVSLGIITCNNKKTLSKLFRSISRQQLKKTKIREILIISTENNKQEVEGAIRFLEVNTKIRTIYEKERKGKYAAVNIFLEKAVSKTLVLLSGDVILHRKAIENLCLPLFEKKVGIVASRPIPINLELKNKLGFTIFLLWELHHRISLSNAKFGELIAFRNLHFRIPMTSVDEEMIANLVLSRGYKSRYSPNSIIYNKGSKTIFEFIKQRRRIYCGHLNMKFKFNYTVSTLSNFRVIASVLKNKEITKSPHIFFAVFFEGISRALAIVDFIRHKEKLIWDIPETS